VRTPTVFRPISGDFRLDGTAPERATRCGDNWSPDNFSLLALGIAMTFEAYLRTAPHSISCTNSSEKRPRRGHDARVDGPSRTRSGEHAGGGLAQTPECHRGVIAAPTLLPPENEGTGTADDHGTTPVESGVVLLRR